MRLFVDTGAWLANVVKVDRHHVSAAEYLKRSVLFGTQLITSDFVLDESVTRLAYDHGHAVATQFLTDTHISIASGELQLISVDAKIWAAAEPLFRKFKDVKLSFTDCTSFALMRIHGLDSVFGFDSHFAMMGFLINPE